MFDESGGMFLRILSIEFQSGPDMLRDLKGISITFTIIY